jgi:hypothetical protein
MKFCLFFAGLLCCSSFFAQSFVNVASQQNLNVVNSAPVLGSGVSFYDYNGDSWPDLTYCVNGVGIVRFENIAGTFISDELIPMPWSDPKTATYADYDNDGDADLLVTRRAANPILFRKDPEGFVNVSAEAGMPVVTAPHSYGACWGDYDKDGFLDCYIANYNWNVGPHNWLMHNNGDGTFTEVAVAAGVDNGQMPSFQGVFTDINRDSWPDLFLINDKAPTNVIYINNGDGTFSDRSAEMNLDYVMDAMSNSISDYDRDGDLDIYVTNDQLGNVLHRNDGDTFSDVTEEFNLEVGVLCWGAVWMDYDNNGYDDLYVLTTQNTNNNQNFFFKNSLGNNFYPDNPFPGNQNQFPGFSPAIADFNKDGFIDVVCNNHAPNNTVLWRNTALGNNGSCTIHLEGVVSNLEGIGSWVSAYVGNNTYDFYTKSGGNYLGQDSQDILIPIPAGNDLDSLSVLWPSGHTDTFYNLESFSYNTLVEGSTLHCELQFQQGEACFGDSIFVEVIGDGWASWNDGFQGNARYITNSNTYQVLLTNEFGLSVTSQEHSFTIHDELQGELSTTNPPCFNTNEGEASLNGLSNNIEQVLWFNSSNELFVNYLSSGQYWVELHDSLGCYRNISFELTAPDSMSYTLISFPVSCAGDDDGMVLIYPYGGTGDLEIDTFGENLFNLSAGEYPFSIIDENGCVLEEVFFVEEPTPIQSNAIVNDATESDLGSIELELSGGTSPYEVYWSNGASGNLINDLEPGLYIATIVDANDCAIQESITLNLIINIEGSEENNSSPIRLYPNPADEAFFISNALKFKSYSIFNYLGQSLQHGKLSAETTRIEVDNLSQGTYILYLYGETVHQLRFAVER